MPVEGNVIVESDITNWGAATDATKQRIIDETESLIQRQLGDIYYPRAFDVYINGNGHHEVFPQLDYSIVTVTELKVHGVVIDTDDYGFNDYKVYFESQFQDEEEVILSSDIRYFPTGRRNIQITGTEGTAVADVPQAIKEAMIMYASWKNDSTLYERYLPGTKRIDQLENRFDMKHFKYLTGVFEVDQLLQGFVRRTPGLAAV